MTRLALALIVVTAGSAVAVTTKHAHHTGTVLPGRVVSREPELRASRGVRRPPLSRRVNTAVKARHDPYRFGERDLRGGQRRHNWTAVAACESSGNWHDNTGNSYYGGLQENMGFWRNYGGLAFARRPDLASESEQITVAERGLAVQGIGAWPYCGRFL